MTNISKDSKYLHLLIISELISKSKKFYKIFKPKEIIELEGYEIIFTIINLGENSFPGGTIKNLKVCYPTAKGEEKFNNIVIPQIPGKEKNLKQKIQIESEKGIAIHSGTVWMQLTINSNDGKKVKYYMLDRNVEEKKEIPIYKSKWEDCFHVASRQEVHQRYTNYILLGLTVVSTLLFLINLVILFR